jgi:hypothetical protein
MGLIDINFYKEALSNSDSGMFQKILPTFIAFILGFITNRFYEFWKERKEINNEGEDIMLEVEANKENIRRQILSLDETIERIKNTKKKQVLPFENFINLDLDKISSINRRYVYKYFNKIVGLSKPESRKLANKIYGTQRIIESETIRLKNAFDEYRKDGAFYTRRFQKEFKDLARLFNSLIDEDERNGIKIKEDKMLFDLAPFMKKITSHSPGKNLMEITEEICVPIEDELNKFRYDKRFDAISEKLSNCFDIYGEYLNIKQTFIEFLEISRETFSRVNKNYLEITAQLSGPSA